MSDALWAIPVRLADVQRRLQTLELEADAARRQRIAKVLDLVELKHFSAEVTVKPWLDGLEIVATWTAGVSQTCGVALDVFDTPLEGRFIVRAVPPGSDALGDADTDVTIDPDADDPPDVMDGDEVDVGGYLVEHLALEVDPFPRRPGVAFEPPPEEAPASPFAVLRSLKPGAESS